MTRVNGPNGGDSNRIRKVMLKADMRCHRLTHSRKGQAIVETALLLPILMLLVMGSADLGRVFYYAIAVTNSAREAARQGTYYDPISGSNAYDSYGQVLAAAQKEVPSDVTLTLPLPDRGPVDLVDLLPNAAQRRLRLHLLRRQRQPDDGRDANDPGDHPL